MKLSVIIPVYNERATLPTVLVRVIQALPSVPKEIVVVDDGSTDGTREWLEETFGKTNAHLVCGITLHPEGRLALVQTNDFEQSECKSSATVRVLLHECN